VLFDEDIDGDSSRGCLTGGADELVCVDIPLQHRHSPSAPDTSTSHHHHHNRFTAFFRDHPGEPLPEENFWTLWCKGRLIEADTPTIRLGATPSGLTSATSTIPPFFFTGRMPFLPPNQQRQSTERN